MGWVIQAEKMEKYYIFTIIRSCIPLYLISTNNENYTQLYFVYGADFIHTYRVVLTVLTLLKQSNCIRTSYNNLITCARRRARESITIRTEWNAVRDIVIFSVTFIFILSLLTLLLHWLFQQTTYFVSSKYMQMCSCSKRSSFHIHNTLHEFI